LCRSKLGISMSNDIKSIFITGGAGCIGLQVCQAAIKRGFNVHLFDVPEQIYRVSEYVPKNAQIHYGSILDCSSLRDAMVGCDAVVHLAAYLGVKRTETNRLRCIEINVNGTQNVLDCAVQHRIKKIVFASSSEVYGEPAKNPVNELSFTQGKSVYAISKLTGEELCKAYAQRYPELSFTILRYFNSYGPYQAAQFVIPRFIRNVLENRPPIIYGSGEQRRSYCYASDTAMATISTLLNRDTDGEIINIGNNEAPVSLSELAELVIQLARKVGQLSPVYREQFDDTDRTQEREIYERYCSTAKAEQLLSFAPKVSLEEGIKKVIENGIIFDKWESTDFHYTLDDWI